MRKNTWELKKLGEHNKVYKYVRNSGKNAHSTKFKKWRAKMLFVKEKLSFSKFICFWLLSAQEKLTQRNSDLLRIREERIREEWMQIGVEFTTFIFQCNVDTQNLESVVLKLKDALFEERRRQLYVVWVFLFFLWWHTLTFAHTQECKILFYFILFYFILFYFILLGYVPITEGLPD